MQGCGKEETPELPPPQGQKDGQAGSQPD